MTSTSLYEKYVLSRGETPHFDPLALIPYDEEIMGDRPLLITRISFRSGTRAFNSVARPDCPYAHAMTTFVVPGHDPVHISYGALYSADLGPDYSAKPLDAAVANSDRLNLIGLDKLPGPLKLFHGDVYKKVPAGFYSEPRRLHDVAQVFVLSDDQLRNVRNKIVALHLDAPHYQVAWHNCLSLNSELEAAAPVAKDPALGEHLWPRTRGLAVERAEAAGNTEPGVLNVGPETTAAMFKRAQELFWPEPHPADVPPPELSHPYASPPVWPGNTLTQTPPVAARTPAFV